MSAQEAVMNPHGVQMATLAKEGSGKGKPSSAVENKGVETTGVTSGKPIVEMYKDRRNDPDKAVKDEQEKRPEITTQTKITAGDTLVRQYMALKDVMKRKGVDLTKPPLKDYANFIHNFETSYLEQTQQNIAATNPSEADLKKFARTLMDNKDHGDMYLMWAIKIAESQQALLQAVTGAHVAVPADKSPNGFYIPTMRAHGPNGMEEVTKDHVQVGDEKWTTKWKNRGKYMFWCLQEPGDETEWYKWRAKEPLNFDQASKSARNVFYFFRTLRRYQAETPIQTVEYVTFLHERPKVDLNVEINGKNIKDNDVEMALLLKGFGKVGTEMYQNADLSIASQHKISEEIAKIVDARANFYQHIRGVDLLSADFKNPKPDQIDDFNMVEPVENPKKQAQHIKELQTTGSKREDKIVLRALGFDVDGEVPVSGGLDPKEALKGIEAGLVKHLEPFLQDKETERIRTSMQFHMQRLKADIEHPTESPRAKAIREAPVTDPDGLAFWQEKKSLLDKRQPTLDQKTAAEKVIKDVQDFLKGDSPFEKSAGVYYTNQEVIDNYNAALKNSENAGKEVTAWEFKLSALLQEQQEYNTRIKEYDKIINGKGPDDQKKEAQANKQELLKRINGDRKAGINPLAQIISETQAALVDSKTKKATEDSNLETANATYREQTRKEIENQIKLRNENEALLAKANAQLIAIDNEIGKKLRKDPDDPNSEYKQTEVNDQIKKLTKASEAAGPDRFKVKQLEVYTQLEERTQPENYQKIRNRATQGLTSDQREQFINAQIVHPNYPPAYLRLMQVIYSGNITEIQANDEFVKATRLVTPEVFMRALRKRNINISDPNDPQLKDPDLVNKIDGKLVSDIFDDLLIQAKTGELGKVSENEQHMIETIEETKPLDIKELRGKLDQSVHKEEAAVINISVKPQQVEDNLKKVAGIDVSKIPQYAAEVMTARSSGKSVDVITAELVDKHTITADQAHEIADNVYSTYGKRTGEVQTASNIIETSIRQHRNMEDATVLAAAALMIHDTDERHLFLSFIEQGKSLDQILEALEKTQKTRFVEEFSDLLDKVNELRTNNPNHTLDQFNRQIRLAHALHYRELYHRMLPSAATKSLRQELTALNNFILALQNRQRPELYINQMNHDLFIEGNVDELTLAMLHMRNQTVEDTSALAYEKMVAKAVVEKREETKRRTVAQPAQTQVNP